MRSKCKKVYVYASVEITILIVSAISIRSGAPDPTAPVPVSKLTVIIWKIYSFLDNKMKGVY